MRSRCALLLAGVLASLVPGAVAPAGAGAVGVYVSNFGSNSVSVFGIGAGGVLAPVTCDPATICKTGSRPTGVALDPSGSHLYVANDTSPPGSVSVFSIGGGGVLAPVTCDPATVCKTGGSPTGVAVDPSGSHVYVTNNVSGSVSVFSIGAGGALTPVICDPTTICATGSGPTGVAVDPSGSRLYVANQASGSVSVFSIGAGGVLVPVTCDPTTICKTGSSPTGVAVDPSGSHLYVTNETSPGSVSVFSIGTGGVLAPVTCDPTTSCKTANGPVGVAMDPSARHLYVENSGAPSSVSVFSIGAGGVLTPVTCDPATICKTGGDPDGIAVDPSGSYLYVAVNNTSSVSVFSIGASGALAPVTCDPATICMTGSSPDFFSLAVSPDRGPGAAFSTSVGQAGSASAFDATASSSPDYPIGAYAWSFGDGQAQMTTTPTVQHTYAQPGNYTAALTVTDQAGCSQTFVFTGQTASCNGSAKASATHAIAVASAPPAVPGGVVVTPPPGLSVGIDHLTNLTVVPATLIAADRGPPALAARAPTKKRKTGAIVSYTGSQPATTTFTVQRPAAGRRSGRSCAKPTKRNRKHKPCTRYLNVGSFTHTDTAGAHRFRFTGRVRGKKLKPGSYRMQAIPRNTAGAGPAAYRQFRVRR